MLLRKVVKFSNMYKLGYSIFYVDKLANINNGKLFGPMITAMGAKTWMLDDKQHGKRFSNDGIIYVVFNNRQGLDFYFSNKNILYFLNDKNIIHFFS